MKTIHVDQVDNLLWNGTQRLYKKFRVLIDSHLTWKYHISHVASKISKNYWNHC